MYQKIFSLYKFVERNRMWHSIQKQWDRNWKNGRLYIIHHTHVNSVVVYFWWRQSWTSVTTIAASIIIYKNITKPWSSLLNYVGFKQYGIQIFTYNNLPRPNNRGCLHLNSYFNHLMFISLKIHFFDYILFQSRVNNQNET